MKEKTGSQALEIAYNFSRFGYELAIPPEDSQELVKVKRGSKASLKEYSVEELVVKILSQNPDPVYVKGIPVVLGKNDVDYDLLFSLAKEEGVLRKLGWILDMTKYNFDQLDIEYEDDLERTIKMCEPHISDEEELLNPAFNHPAYFKLAKRNRNKVTSKWRILAVYYHQDIKDCLELYNVQQRKIA